MSDSMSFRIRPIDAVRAMGASLKNPDDTAQVVRVIDALNGKSGLRLLDRFVALPGSRAIAMRERTILEVLEDRDEIDDLLGWYLTRLRDTHDLWHVLTGYGRDLLGEAALLAFTYAQTRLHGFGFIVGSVYLRTYLPGAPTRALLIPGMKARSREMIRTGWRRGRAAEWLPGQDWEAILPEPLPDLRHRLAISELEPYQPIRSLGAAALAS